MCFVRYLLSGVINQIVFLDYLWPLWDPKRQMLTDKILGNVVVTDGQQLSRASRSTLGTSTQLNRATCERRRRAALSAGRLELGEGFAIASQAVCSATVTESTSG